MYRTDVRKCDFELVTVLDIPMLFTDTRVDKNTVPRGLYVYEVRHCDDDAIPAEISTWVGVNYFGALISNKPLPLDKENALNRPSLEIDGMEDWGYEGYMMTLQDYISEYGLKKEKQRDYER